MRERERVRGDVPVLSQPGEKAKAVSSGYCFEILRDCDAYTSTCALERKTQRRTSMFNAVFVIAYDAHVSPKPYPNAPRELETFTIVFFSLFSMRGR